MKGWILFLFLISTVQASKAVTNEKKVSPSKVSASASQNKEGVKTSSASNPAVDRYKKLNNPKQEEEKAIAQETKDAKAKVTRKKTSGHVMLVPPPPPTIPTYLTPPQGGFEAGFEYQYMSLDDLKFQRENLEKKLAAAKIDEKEQWNLAEEKQEKASRFIALYDEGVVSRRELEASQTEFEHTKRGIEQAHIKVREFDRELSQVKERISSMEAAKKALKSTAKPKKKSSTKKK